MKRGSRCNTASAVAVAIVSVAAGACEPRDQRTESVDTKAGEEARRQLAAPVIAQLDSGSAAFRADDFQAARGHYRKAVELAPDEASAWFGVYMAEKALGNAAAADSALARVRKLAPGATLLHVSEHDTAGS